MKQFISASHIEEAARKGQKSYPVQKGAIITPSARDAANNHNITLVEGTKTDGNHDGSPPSQSVQEARDLARAGKKASDTIASFDEVQIERIILAMVKAAEASAVELAEMAAEETGFGKVEDKTFKNLLASTELYKYIRDKKTVGIIREDTANKIIEIADPMGLLLGIIPSTNPTSTTIFKAIIALKARNGIVFSPHPSAAKCTYKAAQIMHSAAVSAGAPEGIIGCLENLSVNATNELMKCKEVALIIATGGSAMVKAAYSAGKPALGVGPGNVPAYIERTANVPKAVANIIASKTFDYGTICASEQSVIVEDHMREQVIAEFKRQGGYFMTAEETAKVSAKLFKKGFAMNAELVGRSPQVIAEAAGISIPAGTTVLLGEQEGVGENFPLSYEKLTTVLAFYTVRNWVEACELSIELLKNGGIGHTFALHSEDRDIVLKFAEKPVFRILVNTGSTQGAVGASTALPPSFTLGSGTWGGSSTSDNVGPEHLINIKRIAYGTKDITATPSPRQPSQPVSEERLLALVNELMDALKT